MSAEGRLVVLEGMDDALLRDLSEGLYHWLQGQGYAVAQTGEPTLGPAGGPIRLAQQGRLHLDPASMALLRVADRMDHLARPDGILSWLAEGREVLCAHYLLYAYACEWGQVDWPWLRQINARCRPPDLTLFVDTPSVGTPSVTTPSFCGASLRENYLQAIDALRREGETIVVVDGHGTTDEIRRVCQQHIAGLLAT